MQRVTIKQIEARLETLNTMLGKPLKPWAKDESGKFRAQIGNYHLSQAYGGCCVHQMLSEGGGVTTPITHGHVPKRECLDTLNAFINGIYANQNA